MTTYQPVARDDRLPPEMVPVRGAEEDTFAELGTINPGSVFLKHLRTGRIKVVPGEGTVLGSSRLARLPVCRRHMLQLLPIHTLLMLQGLLSCTCLCFQQLHALLIIC